MDKPVFLSDPMPQRQNKIEPPPPKSEKEKLREARELDLLLGELKVGESFKKPDWVTRKRLAQYCWTSPVEGSFYVKRDEDGEFRVWRVK